MSDDCVFKEKTESGINVIFNNAPDPALFKKFQEEVIYYNLKKYLSEEKEDLLEEFQKEGYIA